MALICRNRVPQLGNSGRCGREAHLSLRTEELHDFPRGCLSRHWRRRVQARCFLRPRAVCIRARSSTQSPLALTWNLNQTSGKLPDLEWSPRQRTLHLEIGTQPSEGIQFSRGGSCHTQGLCQRIQILDPTPAMILRGVSQITGVGDRVRQELLRLPRREKGIIYRPPHKGEFSRMGEIFVGNRDHGARILFCRATSVGIRIIVSLASILI